MLYLLRLVLRQLSRVVCRCSRAGWLAGCGRTLVPPRLWMPGGTALPCSAIGSSPELLSLRPCPKHAFDMDIPAMRTASPRQQLACLPACLLASPSPCPPLPLLCERNAMPGHCRRAEKHPASYLAHPVLPLYLYASVPNRCQ